MKLWRKRSSKISFLSLVFLLVVAVYQVFQSGVFSDKRVLGEVDQNGFETAYVERVVDGDTIELSDGRKVRYIGTDTPETKNPQVPVECFGKKAEEKNKELVEGKYVKLEKDVSETDRYNRLLRYVWVDDRLVNLVLIEEGYAFARTFPPDVAKQDRFKEAERTAREAGLGLWGECQLNDAQQINQDINQWEENLYENAFQVLFDGIKQLDKLN